MKNILIALVLLLSMSCKLHKPTVETFKVIPKDSTVFTVRSFCDTLRTRDTAYFYNNNTTVRLIKEKGDVQVKVIRDSIKVSYPVMIQQAEVKENTSWKNWIIAILSGLLIIFLIFIVYVFKAFSSK